MNIEKMIKLGLTLNLEGCVFILSDNKADESKRVSQGLQKNAVIQENNADVQVEVMGDRVHPVSMSWKSPASISEERLWSR